MDHVYSFDGTQICFQKSGIGPPLVLIHGSSSDHNRWDAVLSALEPYFTLYAVDRRGRGASGDSPKYSVEREFEDILAIVDRIGGPVNLLGHSFGGLVALGTAFLTPNINHLILYEPPVPIRVESRYSPELLEKMRAQIAAGDRDGAVVTFSRMVGVSERDLELLQTSISAWASRVAAIHTVFRELEVTEGSYLFEPQRLKSLSISTLLLKGSESPAFLHAGTDLLEHSLANHRVISMAGQQHVAMNSSPELFAREVVSFLTDGDLKYLRAAA